MAHILSEAVGGEAAKAFAVRAVRSNVNVHAMPSAKVGAPPVRDITIASPTPFADHWINSGVTMKPHLHGVKAGHIPGAVNPRYSVFTDETLSVKPADKFVVYCHIGQQATAVIFAARSLG